MRETKQATFSELEVEWLGRPAPFPLGHPHASGVFAHDQSQLRMIRVAV